MTERENLEEQIRNQVRMTIQLKDQNLKEIGSGLYEATVGIWEPALQQIMKLAESYTLSRVQEAIKIHDIEQAIDRLDIQCAEGNCTNCDGKRPRLKELETELQRLKATQEIRGSDGE
jgi:hypothetical protein